METRSKRRRLMLISSNVSPWPDAPARFESLIDDTLSTVLEFVGDKSYRSFGGLNKHCKDVYLNTPGMTKETFLFGYAPLSVIKDKIERAIEDDDWELPQRVGKGVVLYNRRDVLDWALEEYDEYLLMGICNIAAGEGRVDVLEEVWNNIYENDKQYVFQYVEEYAARFGKINVLKWLETKRLSIDGDWCAKGLSISKIGSACAAAEGGQLHILQWLKEEKGLKLFGELYNRAAYGDHLNVMKWLREQGCPWHKYIFKNAAWKGNLNVLQWLHDEGCPWPEDDDYRFLREKDLKPEVIDWCRSNGYGNRIQDE